MACRVCGILLVLIQVLIIVVKSTVLYFMPKSYRRGKNVRGQLVLITGAGGGIGRQLALEFAKLGCKIVCWDVAKQANEETVNLVKCAGGEAYAYHVDITDREDVYRKAELVKKECGSVTVLVNNAGITGPYGKFLDNSDEDIRKTFEVNILAHFWTVKAFLEGMIEARQGHVITISSLAGLVGSTNAVAYTATKFAACGFHESLRKHFQACGYDFVKTTVVCPFFVRTPLIQSLALDSGVPQLEPEYVARRTIEAFLYDQEFLALHPELVAIPLLLKPLLPSAATDVIVKFATGGGYKPPAANKSK